MIRSMTGYGEARRTEGEVSYALEVKSVNNRYFKAAIKLPEHLAVLEGEVEKLLRSRLNRGSVTCTLRVASHSADAAQEVNTAALESYLAQLGPLAGRPGTVIDLAAMLALPGVVQPPQMGEAELEKQWRIVESMIDEALGHVLEMRRREGRAVREDLLNQTGRIRAQLAAVAARAPAVVTEYHQRLLARVNELLSEARLQLQLEDLKREVAVYAERCDINEEVARLGSHLEQFERLCDGEEEAGRKLDFLAQEMLREINTVGSKANDKAIIHAVVEIKGLIDRLKEQVQNVE